MSATPRYNRVLVKLSGESLCAAASGIDASALTTLVEEIRPVREMGVELALVVGGGNICRARGLADHHQIERVTADYMGMLATVINALALRDALEAGGLPARALSAIPMGAACEPFVRGRALRHLREGRVVLLAGGTGSPFFTTDTCAALRAGEIDAEVILKATKVDGVFDADPEADPHAKRYETLTYQQVLRDRLGVMDLTAISMCMDSRTPIVVFRLAKPGNLAAAVRGEPVGTRIAD